MEKMKKKLSDIWKSVKDSICIPDIPSFIILIIFVLFQIFAYYYSGVGIDAISITMIIVISFIPFVMGVKMSNNALQKSDYIFSIAILIILVFLDLKVLNPDISSIDIHWLFYVVYLLLIFLWYLFDARRFIENYKRYSIVEPMSDSPRDSEGNDI